MIFFLWILLGLVLFLMVYAFIVSILGRIKVNKNRYKGSSGNIPIFLKSNKVHTDIVFPLDHPLSPWSKDLHPQKTKIPKSHYKFVGIGWGDKGFYLNTPTWADLTFKTAFKAMTYLSSSAMHCTFYTQMHQDSFCKRLMLTEDEFLKLLIEVQKAFKVQDEKYILIEDAPPYGDDDIFYEAKGRYSIFYTCNTWVNLCLKRSDLPAKVWVLFERDIFRGILARRSRRYRNLR